MTRKTNQEEVRATLKAVGRPPLAVLGALRAELVLSDFAAGVAPEPNMRSLATEASLDIRWPWR